MPLVIVLDTGPLSHSVVPFAGPGETPTVSQQCRQWLHDCETAGFLIVVPAIAYYETLRELERRRAFRKIERLKSFVFGQNARFLALTTAHLENAAALWGQTRRSGKPTASNDALDADLILVAQAHSMGLNSSEYVVATTNVGHMTRFVPCAEWTTIEP